jgi:hypothetical protein
MFQENYHALCEGYLPSVVALAFGKSCFFAECLLMYSAKELTKGPTGDPFAECQFGGHQ